jgi:RHS repeat-associated protein
MNRAIMKTVGLVSCVVLFASIAIAQEPWDYLGVLGTTNFSQDVPVELGFVDLTNGNLHLEIPIASPPQRGALKYNARFVYDSRIWIPNLFCSGSCFWQWAPLQGTNNPSYADPNAHLGWDVFTDYYNLTGVLTAPPVMGPTIWAHTQGCGWGGYTRYSNFEFVQGQVTRYFDITISTNPQTCSYPTAGDAYATDGSGYHLFVKYNTSTGLWDTVVIAPDGTDVWAVRDTNGNFFEGVPDTLERVPVQPGGSIANGSQVSYAVANSEGSTSNYTVTYQQINVSTAFYQPYIYEFSGTLLVASSIALPDGTSYQFQYDSYGELSSMTLPTGQTITYGYTNFQDAFGNINRWLTSRTLLGEGETISYTPSVITACPPGYTSGCSQNVRVTQASGDYADYHFDIDGGPWPTQLHSYSSSLALLDTVVKTYDFSNACSICYGNVGYVHQLTQTEYVPGAGGNTLPRQTTFAYESPQIGNLTARKEWAFYSGSPGAVPDRETDISYSSLAIPVFAPGGGSTFISSATIYKPALITTLGSGTQVSQTAYYYDSYALTYASAAQQDWSDYGTTDTIRGNLTNVSQWVASSSYLTAKYYYDTTGQVLKSVDPAGNATLYSYTDNFYNDNNADPPAPASAGNPTNAYLTQVTLPISGTLSFGYYWGSGKLATSTDQNGVSSYAHYFDVLDRPTRTKDGAGGWLLTNYTSPRIVDSYVGLADASASTSCVSCRHEETLLDSLGRVTTVELVNDPDGLTTTSISYDANGRLATQSNPYRSSSDPTYGVSSFFYDGLNRLTTVTHPDSSTSSAAYGASVAASQACSTATYGYGIPAQYTDEAGKMRRTWTDGLGRIVEVDELNNGGSTYATTCYKYDALNNLIQVAQGSQTRSNTYDGLSRLTSATTPESGTSYYYFTASNGALCAGDPNAVCRKVDARSITSTYTYDALSRLLSISYSDGTSGIGYQYDMTSAWGVTLQNPKGRLTFAFSGTQAEKIFSYDAAGRVIDQYECVPSNCGTSAYHTSFAYDKAGNLTQLTYPSGRVVAYTIGNAGRPTSLKLTQYGSTGFNYPYVSSATYAPQGALGTITFGNGVVESRGYNNRLGLGSTKVTNPVPYTFIDQTYGYGNANNGNIVSITNNNTTLPGSSGRNLSFAYDQVNRLASAQTQATSGSICWGQTFTYDIYGNLSNIGYPSGYGSCTAAQLSVGVNVSTNQLTGTGFAYDSVGDMTGDGVHTYQYDAESRLTSLDSTGANYVYDANNQRVRKTVGSSFTENILNGAQILAERSSTGDWTDFVYFAGQLLVRATSYQDRAYISSTTNGSQYALAAFPNSAGLYGYVIQSGDVLHFVQGNGMTNGHGGMVIGFTDGTNTDWSAKDQNGVNLNDFDGTAGTWYYRRADLSSWAGKTINNIDLVQESTSPAGSYTIYFDQIVIVSADGTVHPIYNGQTSMSFALGGTSSGISAGVSHSSTGGYGPDDTTWYYHANQVGSSQMITVPSPSVANSGYPNWQATFLPFGSEKNQLPGVNEFKFATYGRDTEGPGLDYAHFRFYSNQFGRFMSPDPLSGDPTNPQTWNRYAYVMNRPTFGIDPLGLDGEGGCTWCGDIPILGSIFDFVSSLFGGGPPPPPTLPGPQAGQPAGGQSSGPLGGETLGLPNNIPLPRPSLAGILLPIGPGCEFGPCLPLPNVSSGFAAGAVAIPVGGVVCWGSGVCEAAAIGIGVIATAYGVYRAYQYFSNVSENRTFNQHIVPSIEARCGRKLSPDEKERLHREVSKQGYSSDEIIEIGVGMFCPGR